jgi:Tol biopolymer transport system component
MPEGLGSLSFAPDGRSLMGVAGTGIDGGKRVVIVPVDPGAAPTVLDIRLPGSSMEISWSGGPKFNPTNPQEILVAAQPELRGPHGLYVYNLATGGMRTIVEPAEDQPINDIAWLPDGEHITYNGDIVAADGSVDRAVDTLQAERLSPFSNDGTRIVAHSYDAAVVVPLDGKGERVELSCGPGKKIACPWSWIWSPDDSMLLGETFLLADPATGQVDELDWVREIQGTPAWQRVAP